MLQSLFQIGPSREWKGPLINPGLWLLPARISLKPRLEGLVRLVQVSRHLPVVGKVDKKLLPVARSIPQLPGFCSALGRQHGLSNSAVQEPQKGVCHGKFRINFDCAPDEGYSRGTPGG